MTYQNQAVRDACAQIEHELRTIRMYATEPTTLNLPTTYQSETKGLLLITAMNPFHLLNAARKASRTGRSPLFTALCAEIGARYLSEKI